MLCPFSAKVAAYVPGFPVVKNIAAQKLLLMACKEIPQYFCHCVFKQFWIIYNNSRNQKSWYVATLDKPYLMLHTRMARMLSDLIWIFEVVLE